jgi:hypothetical protein
MGYYIDINKGLNNMLNIHDRLATEDMVSVLYTKADGTMSPYILTHRLAPSYQAKTDRVRVAPPAHLVNAYDLNSKRFVSLKIEGIS